MGQKRDLTDIWKVKHFKNLSEGCSTLEIAKILWLQNHQSCVANSQQDRKKRVDTKRLKWTAKDLKRVKREATRKPLSSSAVIFQNCELPGGPRSLRCSETWPRWGRLKPPLNKIHELKHQDWYKKYLKTDFSKVFWTDEMRVTLDGPDGWARGWISTGPRVQLQLRCQKGGGWVLVWAGIIKAVWEKVFREYLSILDKWKMYSDK